MGLIEPWHLIIILAIVLIIFGPGKLPDIGKAMGKTIKEFRQASSTTMDDLQDKAKPVEGQVAQASEKQEASVKTS
ncbi:MAG: twin-arginine translocase TatA/TatE family subunit [Thermacetogeniaceae bacterium]